MSQDYECQTFPLLQPVTAPSIFHGEAGDDPSRWLKEYERIAKFNQRDNTMCLANACFVKGIIRLWYENNAENLGSWGEFQEQLKIAFGSTELFIKQAERELKDRAQKTGENTQSYIQSVIELCHKVNPKMTENERKRIAKHRFTRLPNVVPVASIGEHEEI
ncbi:CCHC-type domain-containing protein [Trichonephila clavipes]|nr:CCHC-type domain-containing protein [Trichonephila clavipes]